MAVQQATAKLWLEKTGCAIREGYACRNIAHGHLHPTSGEPVSGQHRLPLPSTELALLDDDGNEVAPGTSGEIAIRGPQVMAGLLAAA